MKLYLDDEINSYPFLVSTFGDAFSNKLRGPTSNNFYNTYHLQVFEGVTWFAFVSLSATKFLFYFTLPYSFSFFLKTAL